MRVLGLSAFKRATSAALVEDGAIIAAFENDKLLRLASSGVPEAAIQYCFSRIGADWHSLDAVAIATRPLQRWLKRSFSVAELTRKSFLLSAYHGASDLGVLAQDMSRLRRLAQRGGGSLSIIPLDHHLCHAASAFLLSPFDRALILTLDEEGDGNSGILAVGEGTAIRILKRIRYPHSLGWLYSQITSMIGFTAHQEEHKTQWLSLEGEPELKDKFLAIVNGTPDPLPRFDFSFFDATLSDRLQFSAKFYRKTGLPAGEKKLSDDHRRLLASSVQAASTAAIRQILESYCRQEGINRVCLGGGVFQNSLLVSSLEQRFGAGQLFVPPAPGNAGTALGAALFVSCGAGFPRRSQVSSVFWGPSYKRMEVAEVLDNCKSPYSIQNTQERKLDAAIQLLVAGKVIGWFQGAAEFGPRALGNRSILASPWAPYVKENLNDYIKHREWFRPFAIAVTAEDCARYFECSMLCRHMNSLGRVRQDCSILPENFLLRDRHLRVQVVDQQTNPLFWQLLKRFAEHAPAPMLLNTSFNLFGEPLVVSPRDAVRSYFCSGIDALVIDHFVLSKSAAVFAPLRRNGAAVGLGA